MKSAQRGHVYNNSKNGVAFELYNAAMDFGLAWNPKILAKMVAVFRDAVVQSQSRFAMALLPVHLQVLGTIDNVYPQLSLSRLSRNCRCFRVPRSENPPDSCGINAIDPDAAKGLVDELLHRRRRVDGWNNLPIHRTTR